MLIDHVLHESEMIRLRGGICSNLP